MAISLYILVSCPQIFSHIFFYFLPPFQKGEKGKKEKKIFLQKYEQNLGGGTKLAALAQF